MVKEVNMEPQDLKENLAIVEALVFKDIEDTKETREILVLGKRVTPV